MAGSLDPLVLDLVEWVAKEPRTYAEVMDAWRTSCPRLTVWEDYPGDYAKGTVIRGLDAAAAVEGVEIFHAGTAHQADALVATGGRVLNVTARAKTVKEAQERAYQAIAKIDWPGGFCRSDIGWRALER